MPKDSAPNEGENWKFPREIPRSSVNCLNKIGGGAFGTVWKGLLDETRNNGPSGYIVALKRVNEDSEQAIEELFDESFLMAQIGQHANLVSLVGVITKGHPKSVVLTYCEHGSLLSFLIARRGKENTPTVNHRVGMLLDIAKGMAHLVAKGVVRLTYFLFLLTYILC